LSFGDASQNFTAHYHQVKAAEWVIVANQVAPIILKTLLPKRDYEGFRILIAATLILGRQSYSADDVDKATVLLTSFSGYYEDHFYGRKWDNLRV